MRWKADRLAGGKLKSCKERGEWAELYFMMLAAGQGMKVSKPFGDSASYDVGAENQERVLRVQVKSTLFKRRGECYSLNVMTQRKKYTPGTVDFFAILLIPVDDWYIIPFEVVGRTNCTLHFSPKSKRNKYREYREAWEMLQRDTGLTIHACCDEIDYADENERADASDRLEMTIRSLGQREGHGELGYAGRLLFQLSATSSHAPNRLQAFTYLPRSARNVPSA